MKKGQNGQISGWLVIAIVALILIVTVIVIAVNSKKVDTTEPKTDNKVTEDLSQTLEDGTKLNTSEELDKTKTYNGLEFSNIQITEKNNNTIILANVKNVSGSDKGQELVNIEMLDKDGNVLITIGGIIGAVKNNETIQFNCQVTANYVGIYDFNIKAK